jgi:carbon storage regulator
LASFKEGPTVLVLSRKSGEKILVGGGIAITVVEVRGNRVRLGIEAPAHVGVFREELADHLLRAELSGQTPLADRPAAAG